MIIFNLISKCSYRYYLLRVLSVDLYGHHNYSNYQSLEGNYYATINSYTSNLVEEKMNKLRRKVFSHEHFPLVHVATNQAELISFNYSFNDIEEMLRNAIKDQDILLINNLLKQYMEYDTCPSFQLLLGALNILSQHGQVDSAVYVIELCQKFHSKICKVNGNFEFYLAEAYWINGNTIKSLELFCKIYKEHALLRLKIRCMLKRIIFKTLETKSEASLVNLINFSRTLYVEYDDICPLVYIWKVCFLSDWFADQQTADKLLENHPELLDEISSTLNKMVHLLLKENRADSVYRLTEILLKYKKRTELSDVLVPLLNYYIKYRNNYQCRELIKWFIKNNMHIPQYISNETIVNMLLLGDTSINVLYFKSKASKADITPKGIFEYKF